MEKTINEIKSSVGTGKRDEFDFYPTAPETVKKCLTLSTWYRPENILDVGCGYGVWGDVFKEKYQDSQITGVDIQDFPVNESYNNWIVNQDFLTHEFDERFDLIIGNPPFKYAQQFIEKSYNLLNDNGQIIFLLRLGFLASQKRHGFFNVYKPYKVSILSKRPSFSGDGKTDAHEYMAVSWLKKYRDNTILEWIL